MQFSKDQHYNIEVWSIFPPTEVPDLEDIKLSYLYNSKAPELVFVTRSLQGLIIAALKTPRYLSGIDMVDGQDQLGFWKPLSRLYSGPPNFGAQVPPVYIGVTCVGQARQEGSLETKTISLDNVEGRGPARLDFDLEQLVGAQATHTARLMQEFLDEQQAAYGSPQSN